MLENRNKIAASIVTYKSDITELQRAIESAINSSIEIIYIVDNSPTDTLRGFCSTLNKVEYIFNNNNLGYGSAHNLAIKKSIEIGCIYHVILNPDIEFTKGTIEGLESYMDSNPEIGQIMPEILYPDGTNQFLCKLLPAPFDLIGRKFVPIKSLVEKRNHRFEMRFTNYKTVMDVPFLSGCFMFLRCDALEKTAGFDENFFMYCEDIDLCRRIGMKGYRTVYYPAVTAIHAHKKESFHNKKMLKIHINSAIRYFNKWGWIFDKYRTTTNKATIKKIKG